MEEFEYDGNDILSIKMALENMLESRKKYYIGKTKNNNIINLDSSNDVRDYIGDMIKHYCWNWVEKQWNK